MLNWYTSPQLTFVLYRDHPHIIHMIHSIHAQLCMIFCLLLHMKLCCLLSASITEGFLISSVECPWHCLQWQPVYYGHIGTIHMCTDHQGVHDYPSQFTKYMLKHTLRPWLSVWIMQVFLFSNILIKRFWCTAYL